MLEAVRALAPDAQLAWEAPMACGYGACYGCAVEIDGAASGSASRARCSRRRRDPLLNASGCLDALDRAGGRALARRVRDEDGDAAAARGQPPVRIAETDVGMLNSIGLANPGIERFVDENLPRLARARRAVVGLRRRLRADDYAEPARASTTDEEVEAIELNLSCPNVEEAAENAAEIVAAAAQATARAAVREALARRPGHRRGRARRARRPAPTGSRSSTPSAASRSTNDAAAAARTAASAASPARR